ncbi:hypothetical protein [Vibrio bathopelagicus]|nr:hypothetical protein [Vibrio splendidus]
MAEALVHILLIGGSQLAYRVGHLLIIIFTLGKISIEPLPKNYSAHFVQAVDGNKIVRVDNYLDYVISYEKAVIAGYVVILSGLGAILFVFRDYFIASI